MLPPGFYFFRQRQVQQAQEVESFTRSHCFKRTNRGDGKRYTGTIEPEALVTLSFGVGGNIRKINSIRGERVAAYDVLATLATDELALAVKGAEDALLIQEFNASAGTEPGA